MRDRIAHSAAALILALSGAGLIVQPALAAGTASPEPPAPIARASNYDQGVKLIKREKYEEAIEKLALANAETPNNADVLNYLGYAHRKLGRIEEARGFYTQALTIDPNHKGALEYMGELYVETGDLAKAEDHLRRLEAICGTSCEEYEDLAEAIAAARKPR